MWSFSVSGKKNCAQSIYYKTLIHSECCNNERDYLSKQFEKKQNKIISKEGFVMDTILEMNASVGLWLRVVSCQQIW